MKNNVLIFDSPYCLLIYCIVFNRNMDNTVFIYSNNIALNQLNLPKTKCIVFTKGSNFTGKIQAYCNFLFRILCDKKLRTILFNKKGYDFYGQDHLYFSKPFIHDFVLLEDGLANYKIPQYSKIYKIFLGGETFGRSIRVKKIFLSGMIEKVEPIIKNKVNYFDIQRLWKELTSLQKKEINKIFNYHSEDEVVGDVMILTQPLSEYGFINENDKIDIYRRILQEYEGKKIIIRQHPRELTNYSTHFPDVIVNRSKAPVELVVLNSSTINTVVTLFSSGIFNIPCKNKVFKGTSFSPLLLAKFGDISCESFYKSKQENK